MDIKHIDPGWCPYTCSSCSVFIIPMVTHREPLCGLDFTDLYCCSVVISPAVYSVLL